MSLTTRVGLLAGAAAMTLTGVSSARPAVEGSNQDLAARLAAAEAKIAAMENASNQNWMTEQRASEIKGLVQDVLADADTRASLLQSGMTSGYDKGMILGSADGNWLLKTNFLMQQRFIWNLQDDGDTSGIVDQDRYGFENTRSKFILSGHVVNPSWFYMVDINVGNNGSDRVGTGNAYLGHDYGNGWKIQMGSMKAPFAREELVDAQNQLAVERSNVTYFFTEGYTDGIQVSYSADKWRAFGIFDDGFRNGQTIWSNYDTEYAFGGRFEFLAQGNWGQFDDFTSAKGSETGIMLGAAVHYQDGEYGTGATETQFLDVTLDASLEFSGFNLFGAFYYSNIDTNGGGGSSDPLGVVVQGGFYLNDTWELFARYEWQDFDSGSLDDQNILTVGVNKYFAGHNAKWTTDVGFGLDSVISPSNITGFRPDLTDEDGQVVLRTQWQILF